jgi:MerR family redox-sensitive transcriptional activator SoxR
MTIGEVARKVGLKTSALRYYEQCGLLPAAKRASGRRIYDEAILNRLAVLQFATSCGFTLEEVRELLSPLLNSRPISARWKRLAASKVRELDQLISRAQTMKEQLAAAMACECREIEGCGRTIRREADSLPVPVRLSLTGVHPSIRAASRRNSPLGKRAATKRGLVPSRS